MEKERVKGGEKDQHRATVERVVYVTGGGKGGFEVWKENFYL